MNENNLEALAVIRWQTDEEEAHALYLHKGETIEIGRQEKNDLCLSNPKVSRQHAVIVWRDSSFQIKDLRSINGTWVNQERLFDTHILADGDVIQLDKETLSFFEISSPESQLDHLTLITDTIIVPRRDSQPRLIVSSGEQEGREIILHSEKMLIGRATPNDDWDISLQEKSISRPHAEILREGIQFKITDLDSANGTQVNGEWITDSVELEDGDLIELGETSLVFRTR
jgi:pSer/pThr/pTyr-binding forkhead associated (FHA) protein